MKRKDRTGETNINHQGLKMTIVKYNLENDIIIEFEDGTQTHAKYHTFKSGNIKHPKYKIRNIRNENFHNDRIGKTVINYQGCEMTIIKYDDANHMTVEFNDAFHTKKKACWDHFIQGRIKNPNLPTIYGIGITGDIIPITVNKKKIKEYTTWVGMIARCTRDNSKNRSKTYHDCQVCDEWLYFPNFYNWIILQPNYQKWKNESGWHIDKDIIIKGNKIYSPETCCLVPHYVNTIFKSTEQRRGKYPIGVTKTREGYFYAQCANPFTGDNDHLGSYKTPEEAFTAYKVHREMLIKQLAQREFDSGNISKECYIAMSNYQVEITD